MVKVGKTAVGTAIIDTGRGPTVGSALPVAVSKRKGRNDPATVPAGMRPLKNVDTLTPDKILKGKMVAAHYELVKDYPATSFDEMMTESSETRDRLLRLRAQNTDSYLYVNGVKNTMWCRI